MNHWDFIYGCLIGTLLILGTVPGVIAVDSDYDLRLEQSLETPTRTVTIEGETHTVSTIGRTAPGQTLAVSVTAPTDTSYQLLLYNGDRQIVTSKDGTGSQRLQFNLDGYQPGSYLLTVYKNGDYKTVAPLVIRGYDVAVEIPGQVSPDTPFNASVTITKTTTVEDPHTVQVVLATETQTIRTTAIQQSATHYRASISLTNVSSGTVRAYAAVQGDETAFKDGKQELLGLSDATTLTISEPTRQPTTTTSHEPAPSVATPTTSTIATTTSLARPTTETTSPSKTDRRTVTATTRATRTQAPTRHSTSTTDIVSTRSTTAGVITPAPTTQSPTASNGGVPGFGLRSGIIAVLYLSYQLACRE